MAAILKSVTSHRKSMHLYSRNNPIKFRPHLIRKHEALGFFEEIQQEAQEQDEQW